MSERDAAKPITNGLALHAGEVFRRFARAYPGGYDQLERALDSLDQDAFNAFIEQRQVAEGQPSREWVILRTPLLPSLKGVIAPNSTLYAPRGRKVLAILQFFLEKERWGLTFTQEEVRNVVGSYDAADPIGPVRAINSGLGCELISLLQTEGSKPMYYLRSNLLRVEAVKQ
jgi:hypothetical protein